jgi:hypothetical protein
MAMSDPEADASDHDLVVRSASDVELASSPETIRSPLREGGYSSMAISQSAPTIPEQPLSAANQAVYSPDVEDAPTHPETRDEDVAEVIFFDYGIY